MRYLKKDKGWEWVYDPTYSISGFRIYLQHSLSDQALNRPSPLFNNQNFAIFRFWDEETVILYYWWCFDLISMSYAHIGKQIIVSLIRIKASSISEPIIFYFVNWLSVLRFAYAQVVTINRFWMTKQKNNFSASILNMVSSQQIKIIVK